MAILFSAIGRSSVILCKHALCAGNFVDVIEQVLAKIDQNENNEMTYVHGRYLLHYITDRRVTYACITDETFDRSKAFAFLSDVRNRFQRTYGDRALSAIPYAMNSDFSPYLAAQMRHYSSSSNNAVQNYYKTRQVSGPLAVSQQQAMSSHSGGYGSITASNNNVSTGAVKGQVNDMKQVMIRNIESLSNRGEKMQLLVDRSTELESSVSHLSYCFS